VTGLHFDRPAVRISRLEEALKVLKGAFGEQPFSFDGGFYHVHGLVGRPAVVQRPHPPIFIGASRRRMLELAAHEADIIAIGPQEGPAGATTADQVRWVREAAGDRWERIELSCRLFQIEAPSVVGPEVAKGPPEPELSSDSVHVLDGSLDDRWSSCWLAASASVFAISRLTSGKWRLSLQWWTGCTAGDSPSTKARYQRSRRRPCPAGDGGGTVYARGRLECAWFAAGDVRLLDILTSAQPAPSARFVCVGSGAHVLPLARCAHARTGSSPGTD
jgi:Luciferase-like monooxygenase